MGFANFIVRHRWIVLALVVALAVILAIAPAPRDETYNEPLNFLPADSPYLKDLDTFNRTFPDSASTSQVVIVFERRGGPLTREDLAAVEATARKIVQPGPNGTADQLQQVRIMSPKDLTLPTALGFVDPRPLPNPLVSTPNPGQAALIIASLPYNFITTRATRMVQHIRQVLETGQLPPGLEVAVTGSAGVGNDYTQAAKISHGRTLVITIASIVLILLIVYRAPLAALVPLLSIMMAGFITTNLLQVLQPWGIHIGTAERIFVIVLLYGAGTDYSLLFISRYREYRANFMESRQAVARGLIDTMPAILASAGTNTLGLLTLTVAQYSLFRTTGPAVAIALVVALLTAITLTPAMAAIIGAGMFWPRHLRPAGPDSPAAPPHVELWTRIGFIVTRYSKVVLPGVLVLLVLPATMCFRNAWVYDTMTSLGSKWTHGVGNSAAGVKMVKRHWPVGEIAPVNLMIQSDRPLTPDRWRKLDDNLTVALRRLPIVGDIRSLEWPLGKVYPVLAETPVGKIVREKAIARYVSADGKAMQMTVLLDRPALTLESMDFMPKLHDEAIRVLQAGGLGTSVTLTGTTPEMRETRILTQHDFHMVAGLTLAVILVIVFLLLLDLPLSIFMVASTVLSYLATLGISQWVFVDLLGQPGLDWKVQVFLFVVMVAVGQDYNIFLAARVAQEARRLPLRRAIEQAVVHTGPVISSCGLIMAATLGSLAAGELGLLKQLGFAFATGMLIDTFIVRPLLLPSFAMLTRRTGRSWGLH